MCSISLRGSGGFYCSRISCCLCHLIHLGSAATLMPHSSVVVCAWGACLEWCHINCGRVCLRYQWRSLLGCCFIKCGVVDLVHLMRARWPCVVLMSCFANFAQMPPHGRGWCGWNVSTLGGTCSEGQSLNLISCRLRPRPLSQRSPPGHTLAKASCEKEPLDLQGNQIIVIKMKSCSWDCFLSLWDVVVSLLLLLFWTYLGLHVTFVLLK